MAKIEPAAAQKRDLDALVVWRYQRDLVCTLRWERRHQVCVYVHDGGRLHSVKRFRNEVEAGKYCEDLQAKLAGSCWSPVHAPKHEWQKPR